jgi:hypothetical protein
MSIEDKVKSVLIHPGKGMVLPLRRDYEIYSWTWKATYNIIREAVYTIVISFLVKHT